MKTQIALLDLEVIILRDKIASLESEIDNLITYNSNLIMTICNQKDEIGNLQNAFAEYFKSFNKSIPAFAIKKNGGLNLNNIRSDIKSLEGAKHPIVSVRVIESDEITAPFQ